MLRSLLIALPAALALLLSACSLEFYHMGGMKPAAMQEMNTFRVEMFENHSTQPAASVLLTTALTDSMQRDGTYRLASAAGADFIISGEVTHISRESLLTDPNDTYLSREIGVVLHVRYKVRNARTGEIVAERAATGEGSYFVTAGNAQSSLETALSYAARRAAENITNDLTTP